MRHRGVQLAPANVRDKIVDLLDFLKIEQLVILLDEWTTLDGGAGTTSIQPEFADLLRKVFAGPRFSIKIAANRYQTRLNTGRTNAGYKGLEINDDIFVATNLDRALLPSDALDSFYGELFFRRLLLHDPNLHREFRGSGENEEGLPRFILDIFETEEAFRTLYKGAEGIPRRFLKAIGSLAKKRNYSVTPLWTTRNARDEYISMAIDREQEAPHDTLEGQLLWGPIRNIVLNTRQRRFLVRHQDAQAVREHLDALLQKRFIHEYPQDQIYASVRQDFEVHILDWGTWQDWQRSVEVAGKLFEKWFDGEAFEATLENLEPLVIDVSEFRAETGWITCPREVCGERFDAASKLFTDYDICPVCETKVDEQ